MEKTIEQQSEEIVEEFELQPTSKTFDFIQGVLKECASIAREEEMNRIRRHIHLIKPYSYTPGAPGMALLAYPEVVQALTTPPPDTN